MLTRIEIDLFDSFIVIRQVNYVILPLLERTFDL